MASTILVLGTTQAAKLVRSLDLQAVTLLDGALSVEGEADKATFNALRNVGLNLATFPSELLHMLQAGVIGEIKA